MIATSGSVRDHLPRWSFRTRLALIIAACFVGAGICLLTVQYVLVSQLFDQAVASSASQVGQGVACTAAAPDAATVAPEPDGSARDDAVPDNAMTSCILGGPAGLDATVTPTSPVGVTQTDGATELLISVANGEVSTTSVDAAGVAGTVGMWFEAQSSVLVDDVLTRLLVFSGLVLIAFAVAAAGIAWWLARRSLKRIGEVTAMTKDVSTSDLHRRLELPGPRDEIKELADTIDAMLDRLESAFAAQDRFVANASHELRTPLTTSRTALEIPLAQGRVPVDLQPAVRTALRAGAQSDRLITSLLTLSRGQQITVPEDVDLANTVADVSAAMAGQAAGAGLTVHQTLRSATVSGDGTMLTQAVANLLDNAIRHNVDDGRIWLDVHQEGGGAVLTVRNTGPVIDPQTVALLCEPFYRGTDSRTSSTSSGTGTGVGLGLAIVSSIAKAHGGELEITAREGGGLVVRWRLPGAGH